MKLAEPPENLIILQEIEKAGSYEIYLKEQEEKASKLAEENMHPESGLKAE